MFGRSTGYPLVLVYYYIGTGKLWQFEGLVDLWETHYAYVCTYICIYILL